MNDFINILEMIFDLQQLHNNEEIIESLKKLGEVGERIEINMLELVSLMWANDYLELR